LKTDQADTTYLDLRSQVKGRASGLTLQKIRERAIEFSMFVCASFSVLITAGIVWVLLYESWHFFENVSIVDFLTDTQWTVLFVKTRATVSCR
jgi:phosphate transport system permease protein